MQGLNSTATITGVLTVTRNGENYAAYATADIGALISQPDLRIATSAEFVDANNDVSLELWVDSNTNTLWYDIDIDGGGTTLVSVVMVTKELQIQ